MYILVWSVRVKYKFRFKSNLLIGFGVAYIISHAPVSKFIFGIYFGHMRMFFAN